MKLSKIVYIAAFKRYEPFKSPSNWQCLYVVYHLPVRMRNNVLHWTQDTTTNCKGNIKVERLLNHLLERKNQYGTSTKGIKNYCQRCEFGVRCGCGCRWGKERVAAVASSSPDSPELHRGRWLLGHPRVIYYDAKSFISFKCGNIENFWQLHLPNEKMLLEKYPPNTRKEDA